MNTSGDAAEQIVRISLEGFEVAAKITGHGAKDIAALLYAIMKDKNKTAGKTKLKNMLKSGKELKVFSVRQEDFKKFTEEAKRYGVLYSALVGKGTKSNDGIVDIMVRAEDAAKINRIVDRFKMSRYDDVTIRSSVEKSMNEKDAKDKGVKEKSPTDKEKDEAKTKPIKKEEQSLNPHLAKTEKSPQSKPSSETQKTSDQGTRINNRPSVKEKLEKAKTEVKNRDNSMEKSEVQKNSLKKKKSKEKIK